MGKDEKKVQPLVIAVEPDRLEFRAKTTKY